MNQQAERVIGDCHEDADDIEPFDKPHVDDRILAYARTLVNVPKLTIAARRQGVYVKHPMEPYVVARPASETLTLSGVGGPRMPLSVGLAKQIVRKRGGQSPD